MFNNFFCFTIKPHNWNFTLPDLKKKIDFFRNNMEEILLKY